MKRFLLVASLLAMLSPTTASAAPSFLGQTIDADYLFDNIGDISDTMSNAVVGAGTEFSLFNVEIDLTATDISFSRPGLVSFLPGTFNGWSFFDVFSTIDPIVGVDIISTTVGLTPAMISFTPDKIFVNFVNLSGNDFETLLRVRFDAAAVPEPATVALLAAGLVGIATRRRLTRTKRTP